jgi:hypothetical protein
MCKLIKALVVRGTPSLDPRMWTTILHKGLRRFEVICEKPNLPFVVFTKVKDKLYKKQR